MKNNCTLNLSGLSSEMKFLLSFFGESKNNQADWEGVNINWELFLKLAEHHRIYPTIFPKISSNEAEWIPQHIKEKLYRKTQINTLRMLFLAGETEQLLMKLKENRVRSLFLKGPVLACYLYGELSLRTSSDLDILVPIQELEKVDKMLTNEGYKKDEYIQSVLNDWKWRHHHFTYFHQDKKIKLEIHWRLNPGPSSEPGFNELWERKNTVCLSTTPIPTLSKEDLFLFLVSHGARHGWSRLRWLVDIEYLCKKPLDWILIRRLLKKYHSNHIAEQTLILINQLFKTDLGEIGTMMKGEKCAFQMALRTMFYLENMVNLHDEIVPKEIAVYHKTYLYSIMSWQQKLLFLLSLLYPYPKDKETLPLPKFLHFLYFPLRPFLMAWRKARKQVLTQGD